MGERKVLEKGNLERVQLKERIWVLQARAGELEKPRPEMEIFQKERGEYEEWKKTGAHRLELARKLKGVKEDHTWLHACVLELEREKKEYEKELKGHRQELVERLKGVEEDCEGGTGSHIGVGGSSRRMRESMGSCVRVGGSIGGVC